MITPKLRSVFLLLALASLLCACSKTRTSQEQNAMLIQYLEIVTPDVDATCKTLGEAHDVSFSEPDPGLGNARTAALTNGGRIGVRAPMAEHETPLVRPYMLVTDIEAAVSAAKAANAEIAMPPTEIPGQGRFAIYILGGIQHGLWQLEQPGNDE